ncbi:melanoregulin-like [Megalops cyprinoides]|uniref:melanoregulin-like n=1 Tax=Megalops cyprinoides TaxID=118141 RepID=UPI001864E092|nr:melanoregulin-like [Megalops cyprinoides]
MGLLDVFYSAFCCRCYVQQEQDEKDAILRTSQSSGSEPGSDPGAGREPKRKLWNCLLTSNSNSATEPESDGELQAFIMMRNQVDKDTEEWEKLNYDIHTLKCTRREVNTRWKKILLQMGYQKEVESLLMVNKQRMMSDCENLARARELLHTLWEESSLFPGGVWAQEKYFFVMDRLVSLDSAEDFVRLAKEKYPKNR